MSYSVEGISIYIYIIYILYCLHTCWLLSAFLVEIYSYDELASIALQCFTCQRASFLAVVLAYHAIELQCSPGGHPFLCIAVHSWL